MPDIGEKTSTPLTYPATVRPKPSLARRFVTSGRMWARHTLSRDSLISSLKTFLWVVPLTVMIWIYAEREQMVPVNNFPIKIEPLNNDPNRVVTFGDTGSRMTISADLLGTRDRVERVQRQLEASLALRLEVGQKQGSGSFPISTRSLGDDPLFKENGITVRNIVPEEVTIKIDPVETRELPVQGPIDTSNRLVSFTSDPRTVKVSAPQSFFRDHRDLAIRADVPLDKASHQEGEKATVAPALTTPGGTALRYVTITPSTVMAKYDVRQPDEVYSIPSMAVWVTYSTDPNWNKYMADFHQQTTITDVHVIGPQEVINQLKTDPNFGTPHAYFEVEDAKPLPDFSHPDQEHIAPLHYALRDPRLRVDEKAANATISFKVVPRPTE